jgi:DNA-binding transcriptional LysR family regulator
MERLSTRELEYFVALAEELHFGRAAERLGMAQPPLSRAISQLERRVGVSLLERTSRKVALTPAGEVLLHESRKALDAVSAAMLRSQRAGAETQRLVVVLKPGGEGGMLPDLLAAYEKDADAIEVDLLFCGVGEQASMLRDGRADVGFLHAPHDDLSGFDTERLAVEKMIVVLPVGHRLAARSSVRLAELEGENLPSWQGGTIDEGLGSDPHAGGRLMQLVALGRMVVVAPESLASQLRRDLTCVPVEDAAPSTLLVAWPERSRSRAVAAFVRAAVSVSPFGR